MWVPDAHSVGSARRDCPQPGAGSAAAGPCWPCTCSCCRTRCARWGPAHREHPLLLGPDARACGPLRAAHPGVEQRAPVLWAIDGQRLQVVLHVQEAAVVGSVDDLQVLMPSGQPWTPRWPWYQEMKQAATAAAAAAAGAGLPARFRGVAGPASATWLTRKVLVSLVGVEGVLLHDAPHLVQRVLL